MYKPRFLVKLNAFTKVFFTFIMPRGEFGHYTVAYMCGNIIFLITCTVT